MMRYISVGFSYPIEFKLGAFIISKWIGKPYSHVFIRYLDDQGRDLVFHAAHGTVHLMTYENFRRINNIIKEHNIELTEYEYQVFRDFYYDKTGIEYSFKDLLSIFLYDIFGIKCPDSKGYVCSSIAVEVLTVLKSIKINKDIYLNRPDDVEGILCKNF